MSSALERLKTAQSAKPVKSRPKGRSLADNDSGRPKLLLYGHSGAGKTFFLIGLLLAGEKVYVLSTDFGSNGLATVRNELLKLKRPELMANLRFIDLATYPDVIEFLENPLEFEPDLDTWGVTALIWEGFSSFNVDMLDEYILSMAPGAANSGELRHAGFTHTQQDWQGMKRGTLRALRKFLGYQLPSGRGLAKILTTLESGNVDVNALTGKAEKTVLVQGTGRSLMGPGFDAVLQLFKEEKDGKVAYFYRTNGDGTKYLTKSRGYNLQAVEPADPERVWRVLDGTTAVEVKKREEA